MHVFMYVCMYVYTHTHTQVGQSPLQLASAHPETQDYLKSLGAAQQTDFNEAAAATQDFV